MPSLELLSQYPTAYQRSLLAQWSKHDQVRVLRDHFASFVLPEDRLSEIQRRTRDARGLPLTDARRAVIEAYIEHMPELLGDNAGAARVLRAKLRAQGIRAFGDRDFRRVVGHFGPAPSTDAPFSETVLQEASLLP
ncbi:MAG: hypothetical protein H3C62_18290, partial [Gemmatimonadaceae bacterium]|nr:hypothetical protein [Gemmatimonadaceae bacterium]